MNEEELKNKCTERAKIFQQAMESCHSSSPIDCIEWFADRIAELEKENAELKEEMKAKQVVLNDFKSRVETVTDRFNRKSSQLTKAKEIIKGLLSFVDSLGNYSGGIFAKAEQFLNEVEK